MKKRMAILIPLIIVGLVLLYIFGFSNIPYTGTYKGKLSPFTITLKLNSDGTFTLKEYEPYTGGLNHKGKYHITFGEITYQTSYDEWKGNVGLGTATIGQIELKKE